jgi:hypothetical protein
MAAHKLRPSKVDQIEPDSTECHYAEYIFGLKGGAGVYGSLACTICVCLLLLCLLLIMIFTGIAFYSQVEPWFS